MSRTCDFSFQSRSGRGEWSCDDDALLILPQDGAPLAFQIKEISGIAGDGFDLTIGVPGGSLGLGKLGQDGPTLLEHLGRLWPPQRAKALRLDGSGQPKRFVCHADKGHGPAPAQLMLFEDVLLAAREGEDLTPLFIATITTVSFDEASYGATLQGCLGSLTLTKLAGDTQALLDAVRASRSLLVKESLQVLSKHLPALTAMQKASLSGLWLPGLALSLAELETACPGLGDAFRKSWLAGALRTAEGDLLLSGSDPQDVYLSFARPGTSPPPPAPGEREQAAEDPSPPLDGPTRTLQQGDGQLLWMIVRRTGAWFLESLTEPDHATYRFEGGDEMPGLLTELCCAPQFSREALFLPIEQLTCDRADYAIAARDLGFLRDLRSRFRGRILHGGFASWKAKIAS